MTYNFNQQLTRSKPYEAVLDKHLEDFFLIRLASMTEERQGIDRIIRLRNPYLKVEYKCDSRADTTRNAFIETKSVICGNQTLAPGWAFSTTSDLVIYYLTHSRTGYLINPLKLRKLLPTWSKQFPSRRVSTVRLEQSPSAEGRSPLKRSTERSRRSLSEVEASTQSTNSHYQTEGLLVPLPILNNLFGRFTIP